MKLLEALEILKTRVDGHASKRGLFLLCGFTPLHLQTFLAAHLRLCYPENPFEIQTGLFGDLAGNLERLEATPGTSACIVIEWSDLDPRLGIRSLGGWTAEDISDILDSAASQCERLAHLIRVTGEKIPVYVSLPSLPLPPLFITATNQANHDECRLRELAASISTSVSKGERIRLINTQRLDELSPIAKRFNPKEDLKTGFPYTLEHASKLAELFATLISNAPPRKGLITDLDDTLWLGILGDVGVQGVSWEMAGGAHIHGLYQKFLGSLAGAGVMLAVASKNDRDLVDKALHRKDMLLAPDKLFPIEAHWDPKPDSVRRILERWNIGPNDVVFVDDSPMELAEVKAAFPDMECIAFPKGDAVGAWEFLRYLRDLFGKNSRSAEDEIRLSSIRNFDAIRDIDNGSATRSEELLRNLEAKVAFSMEHSSQNDRAFELINKTNQFNLNGRRVERSEWSEYFQRPGTFLLNASYEDKFGPLGTIAAVVGWEAESVVHVDYWVMSCRAFSRRIEHQCIKHLFEQMAVDRIEFDYLPTVRNKPMQKFIAEFAERVEESEPVVLTEKSFRAKAPALFHQVMEATAQ